MLAIAEKLSSVMTVAYTEKFTVAYNCLFWLLIEVSLKARMVTAFTCLICLAALRSVRRGTKYED